MKALLPIELSLAFHHLKPRVNFVTVITGISVLGVILGVAVLIVVLSIMTGFRHSLEEKIIGFNAEVKIEGGIIYNADELVDMAKKLPEVAGASPYVLGPVLVVHGDYVTPAEIRGLDNYGDDNVFSMKKYLVGGDFELQGDSVVIGKGWGQQNFALPGDKVEVFGPAQVLPILHHKPGTPQATVLPDELTVRGVFQSNNAMFDDSDFLVSLDVAQHIYAMGDAVHGVALRLKNRDDASEVRDKLNKQLRPPLQAVTWEDENADLFNALAMERVVMAFILFLVTLVAAFGVGNTLITVTLMKTREIGLMKAVGATDFQIGLMFTLHGFIVGLLGSVIGSLLGIFFLHERNFVRGFLYDFFHIHPVAGTLYALPEIPAETSPLEVVLISTAAVLVCTLAAMIPSIFAARLAPARALRYE